MKNYILKSLRAKKGLRQKDVAEMLDIKPTTYTGKENGDRKFTVEEAVKLSEIFQCDVKDIFLKK